MVAPLPTWASLESLNCLTQLTIYPETLIQGLKGVNRTSSITYGIQ